MKKLIFLLLLNITSSLCMHCNWDNSNCTMKKEQVNVTPFIKFFLTLINTISIIILSLVIFYYPTYTILIFFIIYSIIY